MTWNYFDAHCDTALEWWNQQRHWDDAAFHVTRKRAKKLPHYAQFFAFCTVWQKTLPAEEQFTRAAAYFAEELARCEDLRLCGDPAEVLTAWEANKVGAVMALEGAEAIGCDPGRLDEAAQMGVRLITLTWNEANALGGSNLTGGGLTQQGRDFVRRCQKLGILVDVSHVSDEVFYDVCEIAEKPIVASHSNCRAICGHPRNLTDDQFRCIVSLGGFAALNFYPEFLCEDGAASVDDLVRHYEHFCDLGGEHAVAVGADWDGVESLPADIGGVDDAEKLFSALASRGVPDKAICDLASETILRVWQNAGARPMKKAV